jgi:1,4-dihydroxy-2-naphthoate octaprenyltransferase
MPLAEPTPATLANPVLRYFFATRPPFLSVTLCAALIGIANAYFHGSGISMLSATVTVVFALVAHAGINVLNDYYDELNGTDRINKERVFPFTGGSRFIQNGVLTLRETGIFGAGLMGLAAAGGLWLTLRSGPGLLLIGAAGMLIGWTYSAPPLMLNSRGWGEACVATGFALIAIGADYVQRQSFSITVVQTVLAYALLVMNILFINQFPDYRADRAAGKHHWVVRLGPARARWAYLVVAVTAYAFFGATVAGGRLPLPALIALLPAVLSLQAGVDLLKHAAQPRQLEPAIKMTIAAACAHGLLLAAALMWSVPR